MNENQEKFIDAVSYNEPNEPIGFVEKDGNIYIEYGGGDEFEFTLAEFEQIKLELPDVEFVRE